MAEFLTDLTWRQIGVQRYLITAPLKYQSDLLRKILEVPTNFITDGESCPRCLPIINSLFGNVAQEAAVVHDWLYYTAEYDRETADKVLLEAMGTIPDIAAWRKLGIYYGLRLGGWAAWNEHRSADHSLREFNRRNSQ